LAKQIQADLVYVNGPRLLPAVAGLRVPVVFHSHSYIGAGLSRWMAGEALRRTDASVIAACRFVAEPWAKFVPRERVKVIYSGVASPPPETTERPSGPPRIGCIGRIAPEKGQREFLRAAAIIHRALPECRFVLCGAPLFSDARAQRYADQMRAEAAGLPVEFTGWVSDISVAMAGLDLLLVPSTGPEATTRVIPEAYAAGVPVIAFPSGGIPEVAAGRPGMLADSVEQMAALAIELLTGPKESLARMSEAAREQWRARFTLERYRQEVLATIECAARGSAARELTNA
jgi:glycosyltransferase involved in cell wall biosynthesis